MKKLLYCLVVVLDRLTIPGRVFSAAFGLFFLIFPFFNKTMRDIVAASDFLTFVFKQIVFIGHYFVFVVFFMILLGQSMEYLIPKYGFSDKWDFSIENQPTPKEVLSRDLFPRKYWQYILFFLWFIDSVFFIILWMAPFVFIAFMMRG